MGFTRAALLLPFLALLLLATANSAMAHGHKHGNKDKSQAEGSPHSRRHRLRMAFFGHGGSHRAARCPQDERAVYPRDFYLWTAPAQVQEHLPSSVLSLAADSFRNGNASSFSPAALVSAGVFVSDPLRGGIFERRDPVQYIILHSTETGRPADAQRVIKSWNRGIRHPGTQYIVDRDGTIYETVDPQFATSHVDTRISLFGVNNSNSVGIEMVRAGKQEYTQSQLDSVTRLVVYLEQHFQIKDDHVLSHHQVQPSDRFDPVSFDWQSFRTAAADLKNRSAAARRPVTGAVVMHANEPPARPAG